MKNKNLIVLALIGFGIYWYYKNMRPKITVTEKTFNPDSNELEKIKANLDSSVTDVKFTINGFKKLGNVPNTI
jgi:hypothetical protein